MILSKQASFITLHTQLVQQTPPTIPHTFWIKYNNNNKPISISDIITFSITLSLISCYISYLLYACSVTQSCLTLCNPMDCSLQGSSIHRIFQAKNTGGSCHFLLQGIFPTQELNPSLLHRQAGFLYISYDLSYFMSLYLYLWLSICLYFQLESISESGSIICSRKLSSLLDDCTPLVRKIVFRQSQGHLQ